MESEELTLMRERHQHFLNACGLIFGFVLSLVILGLGTWLIYIGHQGPGLAIVATGLVPLPVIFVLRLKPQVNKYREGVSSLRIDDDL